MRFEVDGFGHARELPLELEGEGVLGPQRTPCHHLGGLVEGDVTATIMNYERVALEDFHTQVLFCKQDFFLTIIDHKGHLHSRLTESATQSYPKDNPFNGGSARGKKKKPFF